jgi:hypothetical protein
VAGAFADPERNDGGLSNMPWSVPRQQGSILIPLMGIHDSRAI